MARPRKHADGLAKAVSFRLPPADLAAWLAKVEASGLTPSEFFRDCVLTNRTQVVARPQRSADYGRLLYLVNKASNNLNQLAHRTNAEHVAGTLSEATFRAVLGELATLSRFLQAAVKDQ